MGLVGAYNDDLLKMLGPNEFALSKGGSLAEYSGRINSTVVSSSYQNAFASILLRIKQLTNSNYIAGNISGVNLFTAAYNIFLSVLSFFLREQYIWAGVGLTGYFGIQKTWDTNVYAAVNKSTLIQAQVTRGLSYGAINLVDRYAQSSWEYDISASLAQYYLINMPGSTSFQCWGNGYYYGSQNSDLSNFWKAGVPLNMAYQPTSMLSVDIGVPKVSIKDLWPLPSGAKREFMAYQTKTAVPSNSYTVIGNSSQTRLNHPELSPTGYLTMRPSFVYYLQRAADHPQIPQTPLNAVLAREYTKGLVMYRTDVYGGSLSFLQSSVTFTLPVADGISFRRVYYNGSLGPIATSVTLNGYEGAIFKAQINPTSSPTVLSSSSPSAIPTFEPSSLPSVTPTTAVPTILPTSQPTSTPTSAVSSLFKQKWFYNFSSELSWDFNIYQVIKKIHTFDSNWNLMTLLRS